MKDEIAEKDWAMKKGLQTVQSFNDEASKASHNLTNNETNDEAEEQNNKKRVHWSGVQMQGFQACIHIQHCQNMVNQEETSEHRCALKNKLAQE